MASLTASVFAQSFDADKTYTISNNNDANMYMQDMGNGGSVALGNASGNVYWKFIATENADCYYIQNASTGKYIQGYNDTEQEVTMGDNGVEYYVKADAEGNLAGKFRMSCTANSPSDFSNGTLGLNWKNNNTVQSFASVAGGNPRSAWNVVEAEMPQPEQPATLTSPWPGNVVTEGVFYLYNVESGLWLQNNDSKSNDWSTRAAIGTRGLDFTLKGSDGSYTIGANFGSASINPDNNYLDTGNNPAWEFHVYDAKVAEGIGNAYTINCGNKVLGTVKYNEGNRQDNLFTQKGDERWYLENPDFNINMSERITWQLVTKEERLAKMEEEASPENPVDASWLIPAADIANNDRRYDQWTQNFNGGNHPRGGDENKDDSRGSMVQESWNSSSFEYSTTLDVPNGTYRFNLQGYYRDGSFKEVLTRRNDGTETIRAFYFANDVEHPLKSILDDAKTESGKMGFESENNGVWYPDAMTSANRCFNKSNAYVNEEIEVVVTTGKLKIGVKKDEGVANDWAVFDNFHLTYLGNNIDLSDYVNALSKCIEEAEGLDTSNTSTKLAYALAAAIGEAKGLLNSTDTNAMSLATQVLTELIDRVKAVNVDMLRQTVAVAEEGVDVSAANDVIANALTAQEVTDALFDLRTARKLNAMCTPDIFTGSAPADGVEYFIYNIGTGMWLNHGSDYDTHAAIDAYALPITLVGEGENYKLKNHAFNRDEQWINFNAYVDTNGADRWFFQPVKGKENVYNIVVFDRHDLALGYNPYGHTDRWGFDRHYPFNVAKEQTDMTNPNNQWKLVSRAELDALYEGATEENPVDVSYLIKNPELTRVWGIDSWTQESDGGDRNHIHIGDDGGDFNHNSNYGFEFFNANSFSFTQTIEGLKPGLYEVSVSGFFRQGDGAFQAGVVNEGGELISEAYLEANGEQAYLPNVASEAGKLPGIFSQDCVNGTFANWPGEALNAFETGLYNGTKVQCVVGFDGKLTIGVKQDEKTTDNSWVLFDSFHLTYLGPTPIKSMTVVGDFTGGWEIADGLDMTQDSENPAIWTAIVDEFVVELEEGQTERKYEYKATANGVWGQYELPAEGNNNWVFGSADYPAGTYSLLFTADTENHVLTVEPTLKTSTGISELNSSDATKVVYNLNGQRMQQTQRGLYIVNGKKQIVK